MPRTRVYIEGRSRKADQQRLRRWLLKWRTRLHITNWTIKAELRSVEHGDPYTAAQIDTSERYADARLICYPRMWSDGLKEAERAVVHELLHPQTNRMSNMLDRLIVAGLATKEEVDDVYEGFTEWLTNVVWDAYER